MFNNSYSGEPVPTEQPQQTEGKVINFRLRYGVEPLTSLPADIQIDNAVQNLIATFGPDAVENWVKLIFGLKK